MLSLYAKLQSALQETTSLIELSELHGFFTGLLCFKQKIVLTDWQFQLGEASELSESNEQAINLFQKLLDATREQLKSTEFEFILLLPPDDALLSQRLQALQDWCQGFLYGVGVGKPKNDHFTLIEQEFISDVSTFSQRLLNDCVENNDNENAYVELVEYLRAGVFNLYEEKFGH
ncbi:MAG: hypothetical protein RIT27_838 [Pseudomonadota bacterium]|jgi:yecA family protein